MPKTIDHRSELAAKYRPLYKTRQWAALREEVIRRDMGACRTCGILCRTGERSIRTATVDHVVPHRGDLVLFYDPDNLQLLCGSCHSGQKQRTEKSGFSTAVGLDGFPIDANHPANVADRRFTKGSSSV
jgi:5-methylcytosine-specific restriction protein A